MLRLEQLTAMSDAYFFFNARTSEALDVTVKRYLKDDRIQFGETGKSRNAINDLTYILFTMPSYSCVFIRQFDGKDDVSQEHFLGQAWIEGYFCEVGTKPLTSARAEQFFSAIGLRGFRAPSLLVPERQAGALQKPTPISSV